MKKLRRGFVLVLGLTMCGCRQNATTLTDEQAAAVESAVAAIEVLASTVAGVLPAGDLQDFIDNFPDATPTCPALDVGSGEDSITIALDFGESCSPQLYPGVVFGGSIAGTLEIVERAVNLTLDNFRANDQVTTGTFIADVVRIDNGITFEGEVDLTVVSVGAVTGGFNVEINAQTGTIIVRTATLEVSQPSVATVGVVVDDLVIDPAGNDSFLPESGLAIVTLDADGEPITVNIIFTESTPTDGTIRISVNSGTEFSYTLGS